MKKVVFFGVIILVIVIGYLAFSSSKAKQKQELTATSFSYQSGSDKLSGNYIDPSKYDFKLAIYNGAIVDPIKENSAEYVLSGTKMATGSFFTADSVNDVTNFYKKQLGSQGKVINITQNSVQSKIVASKTNSPLIKIFPDGNQTKFQITIQR